MTADMIPNIFIVFIIISLVLMWDTSRSTTCRYCEHCKLQKQRNDDKLAKNRHENYHFWIGSKVENCDDPRCEGR